MIYSHITLKIFRKTGQVIEALVYMHPRTKKHLGMAYVVFQEVGKAKSFVAKNNGTSVMGQTITCIVDPYGTCFFFF